jgi:hypothetical protein
MTAPASYTVGELLVSRDITQYFYLFWHLSESGGVVNVFLMRDKGHKR